MGPVFGPLCAPASLPAPERAAALQALRAQGDEDPQVLSLVAMHFALPPDPDRVRTGDRVGNCTLEEPLGAGGMGVVYRAQQHLGPARRPVAVKLIHPALLRTAREEALARFLAELDTLVTLQHEGIARIYDGGIYEDPQHARAAPVHRHGTRARGAAADHLRAGLRPVLAGAPRPVCSACVAPSSMRMSTGSSTVT